jgi:hypothetical protein
MSGYTEESIVRDGVVEEGINLISKPITPSDLLKAVHSALLETPRRESSGPGS